MQNLELEPIMKLILVEDDFLLADHLKSSLNDQGFAVTHVSSPSALQKQVENSGPVDVIVLDRLLGNYDAKEALPQMRKTWPTTPILILSAISTPNERADLIDMGADDYLGKPFSTHELAARIRALLRRNGTAPTRYLSVGNLVVDSMERVISVGERMETFPPKEFLLVRTLIQEKGRIWSKSDLLGCVWGQSAALETNVVESTIANLRRKLSDLGAKVQIKNTRHAGYWIDAI